MARIAETPLWVSISFNVAALAIFWVVGFMLIQLAERVLGGWPATEIAQLVASVVGALIALRLGARIAAYFVAGMVAFTLAELAIHLVYGIRAAQGAPTHFAVMAAAMIGVSFGAFLVSYGHRIPTWRVRSNASMPA